MKVNIERDILVSYLLLPHDMHDSFQKIDRPWPSHINILIFETLVMRIPVTPALEKGLAVFGNLGLRLALLGLCR